MTLKRIVINRKNDHFRIISAHFDVIIMFWKYSYRNLDKNWQSPILITVIFTAAFPIVHWLQLTLLTEYLRQKIVYSVAKL